MVFLIVSDSADMLGNQIENAYIKKLQKKPFTLKEWLNASYMVSRLINGVLVSQCLCTG